MSGRAFIPVRDARFYLLKSHRQPLAENVAAEWIESYTQPNDLIVDPFVASDAVVRASVARGRRIIASDSNPIVAWAAHIETTLPNARSINAALLRLGDARKEGDTLHVSLEKLYASQCAQCGDGVAVDYFVWRRDESKQLLAEKVYTCARCGSRRADVTETDRQRAKDAAPRGLSYHLLVQRLIADDPANTAHVKRLLELYTPRNLNALAVLTQKLDAEFRDDSARTVLAALMLHALDVGTSLYPSPNALPTRETPAEFIEMNLWRALEAAARGLSERPPPLRLAANPSQVAKSATPAAFVGQGGARFLAESAPNANAKFILSSPARLDPTFWELSFLWTRWLLGKNAAVPLEPLLAEKRQRWSWYGEALTNSLADAAKLAGPEARFAVAFPSGSHAMIEALMLAASPVFTLEDLAFRPERGALGSTEWGALRGEYQVVWKRADGLDEAGARPTANSNAVSESAPPPPANLTTIASKIRAGSLQAARDILDARGEPLAYSWLHHAALAKLASENVLAETLQAKYREGDNAFQFLRHRMEEGFKEGYIQEIDHWEEKGRVLWEKREVAEGRGQLADRVQLFVRQHLKHVSSVSAEELERTVLEEFSGLRTPEIELIEISARAYADRVENEWVWGSADGQEELARARVLAAQLGEHLGFEVIQNRAPYELLWRIEKIIPASARGAIAEERIYEDAYVFVFRNQIEFDEFMMLRASPLRGLIVLPETQVELTRERLRRDPRWVKQLERAGWEFLRIPLMAQLLREEYATRPEFHLAWGLQPALGEKREQLELL